MRSTRRLTNDVLNADRFIARSSDAERWLAARAAGVSATAVARAATPAGFAAEVEARRNPRPVEPTREMLFGVESEPVLMEYAHRVHGVLPNDWLICGDDPAHIATPDGLSLDHALIAEAKTTGKDWGGKPPIQYRRQVQWQLHVTGAAACLLLWNVRVPDGEWFRLAWFEPKTLLVRRDEKTIGDLVGVASRLLAADVAAI